jgi:hypothetical protein
MKWQKAKQNGTILLMAKAKQQNAVVIYKPSKGAVDFRVRIEDETVWLTLNQIASLFDTDKSGISRHIRNIYNSGELTKKATVAKIATVQKEGGREVTRNVDYYNLDLILSVGYRVNSKQATAFRIWATSVLKQYLVKGYAINQKRLEQAVENFTALQSTVQFLSSKVSLDNLRGQEQEIFSLLSEYAKTLSVLEQYDTETLKEPKGTMAHATLTHEESLSVLDTVRTKLMEKGEATDMFAYERGGEFMGIVRGLYQSFGGKELYPTVEQKAAHLLYFIIKDHPFSDGNKRSGSFLFVYFLDKNKHLYKKNGEKKINDNALAALALLVAESDPKEKDIMIQLIINLITN